MAFTAGVMSACAESETTGSLPDASSKPRADGHRHRPTVAVYAEIDRCGKQFGPCRPRDFQTDSPNGFAPLRAVGSGSPITPSPSKCGHPAWGFAGFDEYTPTQLAAWNDALIQVPAAVRLNRALVSRAGGDEDLPGGRSPDTPSPGDSYRRAPPPPAAVRAAGERGLPGAESDRLGAVVP